MTRLIVAALLVASAAVAGFSFQPRSPAHLHVAHASPLDPSPPPLPTLTALP